MTVRVCPCHISARPGAGGRDAGTGQTCPTLMEPGARDHGINTEFQLQAAPGRRPCWVGLGGLCTAGRESPRGGRAGRHLCGVGMTVNRSARPLGAGLGAQKQPVEAGPVGSVVLLERQALLLPLTEAVTAALWAL